MAGVLSEISNESLNSIVFDCVYQMVWQDISLHIQQDEISLTSRDLVQGNFIAEIPIQ